MQYKVMIVDDEKDIVDMLRGFFEKRGYSVIGALSGAEAMEKLKAQPDIILLDINMPGMDGLEVCRRIRDAVSVPILFLTAKIEDMDKVSGFSAGGDDYIVKPFSLMELQARVQAHLRREQRRHADSKVRFTNGVLIDYSGCTVTCGQQTIPFTKKEFEIVSFLSQNPGMVFDKERIYERIWDYDSMGESSVVAEHIRRIRAKFASAGCAECIQTVWGCGYKWVK